MKRLLLPLFLLLPLLTSAQKRHEYTFDFTKPSELIPKITLNEVDFNGAEIDLRNIVLKSQDGYISVSFSGRDTDGLCGVLKTGWPQEDGSFDHYLFIGRGGGMIVTGNGAQIDSLIFGKNCFVGNLRLISPTGVGLVDPATESWYSKGANGVTSLGFLNYGQLPEIRSFTVIYRTPQDVLQMQSIFPSDNANVHSIGDIVLTFSKNVKLNDDAKFMFNGPQGFNPVLLKAKVQGNKVILSLPEGVTIDESVESQRGTYILTIAENSIITDDEDGFYNKKETYTLNVVEAYNKFVPDIVWPDMSDNVEKVDTIVVGFPGKIKKISADELSLIDKNGEEIRTVKAKWLEPDEYSAARPFFRPDRDIYNYVQFVFSGAQNAAVNTSGIYHLTIPEGFIWNNKYVATDEDEGVSAGARFNPEITITYNVNGVVYPSDDVLQAAKDLLAVTGVGYPAANSPARLLLQGLVEEGVGADAVFEEAMAAFYAESVIELPKDGYYLLSAVDPEGNQVYVGYEDGKVVLTRDEEVAVHLLATVNEDGTIYFKTPDGKYLTQLAQGQNNVSDSYEAKKNDFTFSKLEVEGKTPKELLGLWIIHSWLRTTDEGVDKFANALVNFQTNAFETSDERELRYFDSVRSNAFRLTETDEPIPAATYTFDPVSGTALETLYRLELSFTNIVELTMAEDAKAQITLVGSNTSTYNPDQIIPVSGSKNKFLLSFEDVKAGNYILTIPKGVFKWTFEGREATVQEIKANYTVKSGIDFNYDFLVAKHVYIHDMNLNDYMRDVDLNNFTLKVYEEFEWGVSNKVVKIMDSDGFDTYATGHFEQIENFSEQGASAVSAIRLVLDEPIKLGDLPAGDYMYVFPAAAYGDSNFAKWLKDPLSISKNDCHVNEDGTLDVQVNNDRVNIQFSPKLNSEISTFSDVTITFPYYINISKDPDKKIWVEHTYTGNRFEVTLEPIEGLSNSFHLMSDVVLEKGMVTGEYKLIIPIKAFDCDGDIVPRYSDIEVYYYGSGQGDVIDAINVKPQRSSIYDLSGRHVKDTTKSGIYIVNGKIEVVQ